MGIWQSYSSAEPELRKSMAEAMNDRKTAPAIFLIFLPALISGYLREERLAPSARIKLHAFLIALRGTGLGKRRPSSAILPLRGKVTGRSLATWRPGRTDFN